MSLTSEQEAGGGGGGGGGGGCAGAVTVRLALPVLPSLAAVMFAVPAASAVTSPFGETDAMLGEELDQLTERPVSVFPPASLSVAFACVVAPTRIEPEPNETVTVDTDGADTVKPIVPLLPSLVAVIVAEPAATAFTDPLEDTVATLGLDEFHVIVRPVSTAPDASLSVAVTGAVAPIASVVALADSVTVATGAGGAASTAMVAAPV